eukprot:2723050-Prorocentrum_lima.AAC.1
MTSSLVGSEMCIRDRTCGGPQQPTSSSELQCTGALSWKWAAGGHPHSSCLLYTSDAADDM